MPSSAKPELSERQRQEWALLEDRAAKIRSGAVKPTPGNEMDELAAFVATKLPELYEKHKNSSTTVNLETASDSGLPTDPKTKYEKKKQLLDVAEGNAHTNVTRGGEEVKRFLTEKEKNFSGANATLPVTSTQRDHGNDPSFEGPFGPWDKVGEKSGSVVGSAVGSGVSPGAAPKKSKSGSRRRNKVEDDDAASDVGSMVSSVLSTSSVVSGSDVESYLKAEEHGGLLGDTLGITKKKKKKHHTSKKHRSKSASEVGGKSAVFSDDGSYISNPITYDEDHPPLFDKYFFYSNKIMKNIGRFRPPQNGIRTLGQKLTLDNLIEKNGGIPEMAKEKTDYKRNFRFPFDTRSEISVELQNPITKTKSGEAFSSIRQVRDKETGKILEKLVEPNAKKTKKIDIDTVSCLEKSHLKGGEKYAGWYGHQFLHPMPSMAPRVFEDKHVGFDKLFKHRANVRRPKDYD
eukprot:g14562.t1